MNAARLAAWLFGAAVCGAWLASAAGISRYEPVSRPPQRAPVAAEMNALATDVQAQTGRLRDRLAHAPAPSIRDRNPFTFTSREVPVRRPTAAAAPAVLPPAPEVEREPALNLIGVAERKDGDRVIRTAMISGGHDELMMVTIGQRVLNRYEVVAIGADAVELRDLLTTHTRRLALQ